MKKWIKNILIIILIFFGICLFFYFITLKFFINQNNKNEDLENSPFKISKVVIYSSAYGENQNTNFSQSSWILNILQYSDIAIYLNNKGAELNQENSVKNLSLENIEIEQPKTGSSTLYYLDSLNFGTPNIDENYKIENSLEFTVLNDTNEENKIQYNTPVFFTDCSNPLTLKYVNSPVKEKYNINSNESVFFDGRLLKLANVNLNDLSTNIKLDIKIKNNLNKNFIYTLAIPINLTSENSSIYDGSILIENENPNYQFITKKY